MSVRLEIQRRAKHAGHLLRAGFPSLWTVVGALVLLVGGSALLALTWGIKHLIWGVVIALVIIIVMMTEGSYRESRNTALAPGASRLLPLRRLVAEGRAMQARLPPSNKRGLAFLPSDLLRDFETWKANVVSELKPWPTCLAQFQGRAIQGFSMFETERRCSEIEQRTNVLDQIVRTLAEQGLG